MDFEHSFSTDEHCIAYLFPLKYENGFECNFCFGKKYWQNKRNVLICKKCKQKTRVLSGTIFHKLLLLFQFNESSSSENI
jgi:hypothetical protein